MAHHRPRDSIVKKTSIRISSDVWERVKRAAPVWAQLTGITPQNRVSVWVELVLDRAAREQLESESEQELEEEEH